MRFFLQAALLVGAAGIADAKVLFKAGFETGDLSEWSQTGTRGQNAKPGGVDVVSDVVHSGKYAGRFTIHETDVFNTQQLRVQLGGPRVAVEEGSDTYLSFYLYMAEAPKDRDNFFYWEGNPPPRYNNVMTWWVEPKDGKTLIKYGTGNLGRNGTEWEAEFTTGKWHHLAMHIHWSEDPQKGNTRLWLDGALVLDRKLKTKGPESVYFCQPGIHRSPHKASVDTIYFDDFVLADTLEEVLPSAAGFADAANFGFSPAATGMENAQALQRAVNLTGTIVVSQPGTYKLAQTVHIGSNTSLIFGNGVFIQKVAEQGPFTHVLLNKGALTKTWDQHITVSGLNLIVNGVDVRKWEVYGLHGQIAFFYVKDLRVDHFRCFDLGRAQYAIHVCTFENIVIEDVHIEGGKDGVHLGRGKRFTIRNGTFETGDDAIALNAHDYSVGNPELGWIEEGVIENMHDLPNPNRQVGYFARILAGAWIDWKPGMEVQQSDTVVSEGRLYRVQANPDGKVYASTTRPTHRSGQMTLDGIPWGVVQDDVTYTAGVRNVVFRDIYLGKARTAFSIHFDNDKYSRSYYPGAPVPRQENILLENVRVLYDTATDLLQVRTPVDTVSIANSTLRNSHISFLSNNAMTGYEKTRLTLTGCTFAFAGALPLLVNKVPGKAITLKTAGSIELSDRFSASVVQGGGAISVDSDLTGLKTPPR